MKNPFANPDAPIDHKKGIPVFGRDVIIAEKNQATKQPLENILTLIAPCRALAGERKTQGDWIDDFNEQGMQMIGTAHQYDVAKLALKGNSQAEVLLKDFQSDYLGGGIMCSDHVTYRSDKRPEATLSHNYKSTVVTECLKNIIIPTMNHISLRVALKKKDMRDYAKSLFRTDDDDATFKSVLEKLSNVPWHKIIFRTPLLLERKNNPERGIELSNFSRDFHVNASSSSVNPNDVACSRGVRIIK